MHAPPQDAPGNTGTRTGRLGETSKVIPSPFCGREKARARRALDEVATQEQFSCLGIFRLTNMSDFLVLLFSDDGSAAGGAAIIVILAVAMGAQWWTKRRRGRNLR
jgi:hypothetical protein